MMTRAECVVAAHRALAGASSTKNLDARDAHLASAQVYATLATVTKEVETNALALADATEEEGD